MVKDSDTLARVKDVSSFNSLLKITHILKHAAKIILSHKLKDNKKSNPKLPSVIALKNGPRLKLPETTPDEVNSLFFTWIRHYQSVYFSEYLEYFNKKRKIIGNSCQCCPPTSDQSAAEGADVTKHATSCTLNKHATSCKSNRHATSCK